MPDNRPMLPDDAFRIRRDRTIAVLRQWGQSVGDCAKVAEVQENSHWWFVAIPRVARACRFELMIYNSQKHDLAIGAEVYEERPLEELDRLLSIAEAIAAGRASKRMKKSANTGALLAIETNVRLADGQVWRADRWLGGASVRGPTVHEDRWYLPYRR
jgi:hypothetical protein